jgi:hypothetical protein
MENERKRKYYSIKKDGPNFHRAPSILCCLIEGGDLGNPHRFGPTIPGTNRQIVPWQLAGSLVFRSECRRQ